MFVYFNNIFQDAKSKNINKGSRTTKRKTVYNDRLRKRVKRATKKFQTYIDSEDKGKATESLKQIYKVLDKAAKTCPKEGHRKS